jgi:hypothetical protein
MTQTTISHALGPHRLDKSDSRFNAIESKVNNPTAVVIVLLGNSQHTIIAGTRNSSSEQLTILVVHPVTAFLTLLCLGMAFAAHFHAPSHSPRYKLSL